MKDQAAMLARRHREYARVNDAAIALQAHWRGRQHRRLCRFLRARRTRLCRLDWLDHLEWTRGLLNTKSAASQIQAAWRAARVRRALSANGARTRRFGYPGLLTLSAACRGGSAGEGTPQLISYGEISLSCAAQPPVYLPSAQRAGKPSIQWAAQLSEIRPYEIDSRPPVARLE